MGNIWEKLGNYGYKSEQPAPLSRKAAWSNPSPLWDLGFLALKASLISNPSLSRSEDRTTLSLTKKEVAVFSHSCQIYMTYTLVQVMRSWFNYHLPDTIQNSSLPEKCHKVEAESFSSGGEGSYSYFLHWMFHFWVNRHWDARQH